MSQPTEERCRICRHLKERHTLPNPGGRWMDQETGEVFTSGNRCAANACRCACPGYVPRGVR